jgi:hypothetical protein
MYVPEPPQEGAWKEVKPPQWRRSTKWNLLTGKKKKVWVTNHEVLMTHLLTLDEDSIASS